MSNLLVFPRLRDARREASLWIVRVDRGLDAQESQELRAWAAAAINRRALDEMAALWSDLTVLSTLAELFPHEAPQRQLEAEPQTPALRSPRRLRALAAALAGTVLVAGAVGFALQRQHAPTSPASFAQVEQRTLETPIGGTRQIALRDGSAVTLNTDSELSVSIARGARELRLERGEAYFRVAHDPAPFRVLAAGRLVEAVGTVFSVRVRQGGAVDVLVTEGAVRVEAEPGSRRPATLVRARQLARIDGAGHTQVEAVKEVDLDVRLAWQRGMLIFRGEPLDEVLQEFGRYTTEKFVFATPELRKQRVGGYFRAGDTEGLLVALRENFHIVSTRDPRGGIVLNVAR
jgi:transmembrane sensor